MNNEIKNGVGVAYRAIENDINEITRDYYGGEKRMSLKEINNKKDGIEKIHDMLKQFEDLLRKFERIALTEEEQNNEHL